eukprot:TRINITY_DN17330_c0_g1_i1.p1 TRINITY_DN17330_c0_g1~~TRINITY_DN17330_c0_g1_i1.p1  ORF type:complete len:286 (-),score=39.39 TRINITY_DN17330_c0_g1_i1:166-1023(-)
MADSPLDDFKTTDPSLGMHDTCNQLRGCSPMTIDPDELRCFSWTKSPSSSESTELVPDGCAQTDADAHTDVPVCTASEDDVGGSAPMLIDPVMLKCFSSLETDTLASGPPPGLPPGDHVDYASCKRFGIVPSNHIEVDARASARVPTAQDGDVSESNSVDGHGTTVLVQELPCKVGAQRMMAELKLLGLDGCYSFINFPTKSKKGKQVYLGYGFINFVSEDFATDFMRAFEGYHFADIDTEKRARVNLAHVQGQPANKKRLRSSKKRNAFVQDARGLQATDCLDA